MATTGNELVRSTLRLIGASAKGNTASAEDVNDGLKACNQMLSSWRNEALLVYCTAYRSFNITNGKTSYFMSIDPSADFQIESPVKIVSASVFTSSTSNYVVPITNIETYLKEFNLTSSASLPAYCAINYEANQIRINFYPIPSGYTSVMFGYWERLQELTLNGEVILPDGYEEAIRYNLAIRLCPEYGIALDPLIMQIAKESLASIKAVNLSPVYMDCNTVGTFGDTDSGDYNIYRGY